MSCSIGPYTNVPLLSTYPVYGYKPLIVARQVGDLGVQGSHGMVPSFTDHYGRATSGGHLSISRLETSADKEAPQRDYNYDGEAASGGHIPI